MTSEFFCAHCLETTEAADYPKECPHCRVGFAQCCGMRLKSGERKQWCPGCGAIGPEVTARMYRTSSTAGAYAEDRWVWEGIANMDSFRTHEWWKSAGLKRYGVSVGWETSSDHKERRPTHVWLRWDVYGMDLAEHFVKTGDHALKVRDLTDDECRLIGYRTREERERMARAGDAADV